MSGVGYYVHHVGSGHRHRATALAVELAARGVAVTGLSSASRPDSWPGPWVELARDDEPDAGTDVTANDTLHWVPLHHRGLSRRMAQLSAWIDRSAPDVVVSDVSQEVTLLARLHGVPVVSVVLPGRRADPPHALGLRASSALVGFWPATAVGMSTGLPHDVAVRLQPLGGLSRYGPVAAPCPSRPRTLVVLCGTGGGAGELAAAAETVRRTARAWHVQVLGGRGWVEDPFRVISSAAVVLTHAGQNAVAEVAAARVPALVRPQARPFDEQITTAAVLDAGAWPVRIVDDAPRHDWPSLLEETASLDGAGWSGWVDGDAAERFAEVVTGLEARP